MWRAGACFPQKSDRTQKTRAPRRGTTQGPTEAWLWGLEPLLESRSQARLGWDCGAKSALSHKSGDKSAAEAKWCLNW